MGQWVKRSAAGIGALVFLVTSLSLTILVIWVLYQENKNKGAEEGLQETLQQMQQQDLGKLSDFTPLEKVDELKALDTKAGSGPEVKAGDTVTVTYTGALAKDGTIFDSTESRDGQPLTIALTPNDVIVGWVEGLKGMKEGGTRRLLIPARLAYKETGNPPRIGPNEPLVFDIQLIKIGP